MTTATQTPPEKCPVCGWDQEGRDTDEGRVTDVYYNCGARWVCYSTGRTEWIEPCPHAMTAALRVGATLEPTPLELARDTLLKEALSEANEMPDATLQFKAAARAYRALLEPTP